VGAGVTPSFPLEPYLNITARLASPWALPYCGVSLSLSISERLSLNTQGDSDVMSMPAGFRRHLVRKTLRNVFHCDIAEIRFVGKLVIIQTFS